MSNSTEKNKRKAWKKDIMKMSKQDIEVTAEKIKIITAANESLKTQLFWCWVSIAVLLPISIGCGFVIYYMRGLL